MGMHWKDEGEKAWRGAFHGVRCAGAWWESRSVSYEGFRLSERTLLRVRW